MQITIGIVLELDCILAGYISQLYFHREIKQSIHQSVISSSFSTRCPIAVVLISLLSSMRTSISHLTTGRKPAKEWPDTIHSYPICLLPHRCDTRTSWHLCEQKYALIFCYFYFVLCNQQQHTFSQESSNTWCRPRARALQLLLQAQLAFVFVNKLLFFYNPMTHNPPVRLSFFYVSHFLHVVKILHTDL